MCLSVSMNVLVVLFKTDHGRESLIGLKKLPVFSGVSPETSEEVISFYQVSSITSDYIKYQVRFGF